MKQLISIIVPCLNEAKTIGGLLDSISRQTVDSANLEVLIVDGGSTDGTKETVRQYTESNPDLMARLVENPERIIPAALNLGIGAARGEIIIRLDAHSEPALDYVEKCVETLRRTRAANVGGQWRIKPGDEGWQAKSIAVAAAHPLGAGDARYRISGEEGPVDTVPFGAFRRKWLERVGPFNEELLTNEDYEYNLRIRQAGGVIWFNPEIEATYFARSNFKELARQYSRYGYWKAQMIKRFPDSLRWRQALPPVFVLATLVLLLAVPFSSLAAWLLALQWGSYGAILLLAGLVQASRQASIRMTLGFPVTIMIMHLAWGASFLGGLLISPMKEADGT